MIPLLRREPRPAVRSSGRRGRAVARLLTAVLLAVVSVLFACAAADARQPSAGTDHHPAPAAFPAAEPATGGEPCAECAGDGGGERCAEPAVAPEARQATFPATADGLPPAAVPPAPAPGPPASEPGCRSPAEPRPPGLHVLQLLRV